ncbi:MFS transporter [Pararobbsia silviterrae]|nr:MFS transporter [Pararobbsia silviterrae]
MTTGNIGPDEAIGPGKWRVLWAAFMSYCMDAMDFMLLAVALPTMIRELHLSMTEAGLLGTAGLLGVGFSAWLLGWCSDNYGRKNAMIVSVLVFGIMTAAISVARDWTDMMVLRFIAGLGLGGLWGVAAAYINETWPRAQRGRAAAFVLSSWPIGFGIAAMLAAAVIPVHGWRVLFLFGFAAIPLAFFIWRYVPESEVWLAGKHAADQTNERVRLREIFAPHLLRQTVVGTVSASCALVAYWGVNTWLPSFLTRERGLSPQEMAHYVVMLNVGMFIGYQLFGYLADRIGRKLSLILCFLGGAITLPLYVQCEDRVLLFWAGPVIALFFSYAGVFGSLFAELYPPRIKSLGAGFCFNVGRGISAFAPFLLGSIATHYSLGTGIALCGISFATAGVAVWLLPASGMSDSGSTTRRGYSGAPDASSYLRTSK